MNQPLYDIYFTGQLVEGTNIETAKINAAKLFKSTPENMAKLFTGKPQALKRGIDKATTLKYKAAFHQAGLLVSIRAQQTNTEAPSTTEPEIKTSTPASPAVNNTDSTKDNWSLAAVGSNVLSADERATPITSDIDTSTIKMVSTFIEPEAVPTAEPPPAPNTNHISVAQTGEDLLVEKPEIIPPLPLNLDAITLAPTGSDLEQIQDSSIPLSPDISALSIAETGVDLLEGQVKLAPPSAPDTTHISIAKD